MSGAASRTAYAALLAVFFFWGTTYLGIRMSLETFPPLVMITGRFLLSGSILLAIAYWRGAYIPRDREFLRTGALGVLTLGCGNGCLTYSELWIPSGLAALFLTTSPFWMVGLESRLGSERIRLPIVLGIAVGFAGVLVLIAPAAMGASTMGPELIKGFVLLQIGCVCWCLGAILQRRQTNRAHPVVSAAIQQFVTGVVYILPALFIREHPVQWSTRGVTAFFYLVVFGSIVGYTSYIYALEHLPIALVTTHNYVNVVVAVFLGWLFYREPVGWRELVAMACIFAGVAIVKLASSSPSREPSPPAPRQSPAESSTSKTS